jgi:hypothetical protein
MNDARSRWHGSLSFHDGFAPGIDFQNQTAFAADGFRFFSSMEIRAAPDHLSSRLNGERILSAQSPTKCALEPA